MKKLLSILLTLTFVLSVLPGISVFAQTEELLKNPGFEDGDKNYSTYGQCSYEIASSFARTGKKGLLIKDRTSQYGTVAQNIANILTVNGPGKYKASMWVRLQEESTSPVDCTLTMNIYSNEFSGNKYFSSGKKVLTTQWQQFSFEADLSFDPIKGFNTALIYQQSFGANGYAPNVLVDDISLVKLGEVNGVPLDKVEGGAQNETGSVKQGNEMLSNPGFEEGDDTDWDANGASDATVGAEYAHSGDYGMLIKNRTSDESHSQNVEDALTLYGPGQYKASVWVRLPEETDKSCTGQLRVIYRRKDGTGTQYKVSAAKKLTTEWQQIALTAETEFEAGAGFEEARIYLYTTGKPDIILDDFSLIKTSEVSGVDPSKVQKDDFPDYEMKNINILTSEREEETSFGAIRWDAWFTHNGRPDSIVTQVEKTLSPAEYHFRAPFFANITNEGKIEMPKYTQEIFDQEMEYAKAGGIDYFAYLWYDGEMSAARKMHPTSKYKDDVKMCIILDGNGIGKTVARTEILSYLNSSFYFKVLDGRPLMYYYINTNNKNANLAAAQNEIKYYRAKCDELGIPAPFAVIMNVSGPEATKIYGDAVSRYSISGTSSQTFNDYITGVQNGWSSFNTNSTTQYVPYLSFGWHTGPRFKNQVSWMKVEENSWVPYPTDEEMYNHISYALSYMDHPNVELLTKINTVIFYAWNEHDEGSWLCPTIAVDENGNQLYNEDGTKKINDSRIKILAKAIEDFKNGKRTEVIVNGISNINNSDRTPKPTDPGTLTDEKGNPLFLIIGISAGVVALAGGVVATLVVIKKKKKNQEENTEEKTEEKTEE